jgi:hypothetical protein
MKLSYAGALEPRAATFDVKGALSEAGYPAKARR